MPRDIIPLSWLPAFAPHLSPEPVPEDAVDWHRLPADHCALCPGQPLMLFVAVLFDDQDVIAAEGVWSESPAVRPLYLCFHHGNELEPVIRRWGKPSPGMRRLLPGWSAGVSRWRCVWDVRAEFVQREWANTHLRGAGS
jgi:hypothetical protein